VDLRSAKSNFYSSFNSIFHSAASYQNELVVLHLVSAYCKSYLLYTAVNVWTLTLRKYGVSNIRGNLFDRSQSASASSDFMALYKWFDLLTYLLTYLQISWLIDGLFNGTSTQKRSICANYGEGKLAQAAKDRQRDTMHNFISFPKFVPHKLKIW